MSHNCLIHLFWLMKQRSLICFLLVAIQAVWFSASAWNAHWWSMAVMQKGDTKPAFLMYCAAEDTVVNGVAYFSVNDYNYLPGERPSKLPYGYRMADKKIYIYNFDSKKETVAMDFTLSVGDHFTTYNGMQWEVEAVKDTLVNVSFCGWGDNVSKRLLRVRTLDGTMTDQWLEDFGSFANHFMIRSMENVLFSHTLWMEYGYGEYLARDISADPFYAHASKWMENDEDVGDGVSPHDTYTVFSYGDGTLSLVKEAVTYGHRFYTCFYRSGDNIYSDGSEEMDPLMDCPLSLKIDSFQFVGVPVPASGAYTLHVGDDSYSTGIRPVMRSPQSSHRIYDAQGRQLPAKPKRGLYIQDGVKYNAR